MNRVGKHITKTLRNNRLVIPVDKTRFNNRYKLKMSGIKNELSLIMSQHNAKNSIKLITDYFKEIEGSYNTYAFILR